MVNIYLSIYPSIYLSIYPTLSIYLSIQPFLSLSLSIYFHISIMIYRFKTIMNISSSSTYKKTFKDIFLIKLLSWLLRVTKGHFSLWAFLTSSKPLTHARAGIILTFRVLSTKVTIKLQFIIYISLFSFKSFDKIRF